LSEKLDQVLRVANEYRFIRIIPATNIDSLITAGILFKNLKDHGIEAVVNLDTKYVIDYSDEPILLIDLPKHVERKNLYEIRFNREASNSGYATYYLDKTLGVSRWDKVLSIISGIYRGLDSGREGFKTLERDFLDELVRTNYISIDLGFKLWGRKRHSLLRSIYRTLIPFIPGYSGDPVKTADMLKTLFNISDPDKVRSEDVFSEKDPDKVKVFLQHLDNTMELLDTDTRRRVLFKLIGYLYTLSMDKYTYDLHEVMGALTIFNSLEVSNPNYVVLTSLEQTLLSQIMVIYDDIIDEASIVLSSLVKQVIGGGSNVIEVEDIPRRPEVLLDMLSSLEIMPREKPLIIRVNGSYYTCVYEYLRINMDSIEKTYRSCDESQLCRVDENGALIQA